MKRWPLRALLIAVVAGSVATLLPAIRESLAVDRCRDGGGVFDYAEQRCRTDIQALPPPPRTVFRAPDGGSLVVALAVALALTRLFVTIDRRARARAARTSLPA